MAENKGFVIWFTGLSGAGKTTLSQALAEKLRARGLKLEILDGDEVRTNLSKGLGFSKEDRDTNVRRIGYVSSLLARNDVAVIAAAISRFASTLDGLRGGYLEDPAFAAVAAGDLRHGRHRNPTGDPAYFTTAYLHRPEDLAAECAAAGLTHEATLAVEGAAWLLPDLDVRLADERRRAVLLAALASLEAEPTLLGVSAHLLMVARRV